MAKLPPPPSGTLAIIDELTEHKQDDWRRAHLGDSIIGDPCERLLWYSFRWFTAPKFPGRILRLFRRGQEEESTIVADLRMAGITVSEGPAEGEQWRFSSLGGHFGGSMDAAILGLLEAPETWHVGEFKTHNKKSFDLLLKEGVQKSKPRHFAQMQSYMHKSGMKRAVYIAVCKDDDRYYLERIHYDKYFAGELQDKASRVIFANEPPTKLSERADHWLCKWCSHYGICHQGEQTEERNCRTCEWSEPQFSGGWYCNSNNLRRATNNRSSTLSVDDQKNLAENCHSYLRRKG